MFNSKKAQLTLIIILGLLLLVVFYFLFSLKKDSLPKSSSSDKLLYEIESGLIKDHITSCIQTVSADAVEKIVENGGVIYDFDGGTIPFNSSRKGQDFIEYPLGTRIFHVSYGLKENTYCPALSYDYPDYPVQNTKLQDLPSVYLRDDNCAYYNSASDYDGVYGQVTLPKMCPLISDSSCPSFAKGSAAGLSMENQAQDYVTRKLDLCVNLSYFEDQFDAEIVKASSITTVVSIREKDVQVSVTYPLKITFKDAQPISKVAEYHASLNIRLGQLYFFLYDSLSKDVRDLNFDLEKNYVASTYWSPGFELKKINDPCASCSFPASQDNIIEVRDSESVLKGKPLIIRTAIMNRRPALDFIPNYVYELAGATIFSAQIPIKAIDPDDTEITYYFLSEGLNPGWRESPPAANSPITTFGAEKVLDFLLSSRDDHGFHHVAILAVDQDGFFDFQRFTIEVKNNGLTYQMKPECLDECTFSQQECDVWCSLAANNCVSECQGEFGLPGSSCRACVEPLFYAASNENHISCIGLTRQDCIKNVPDCFWLEESELNQNSSSSCKNDRDLEFSKRYSAILIS